MRQDTRKARTDDVAAKSKATTLVVDIGNTSTSIGLFSSRRVTRIQRTDTRPITQRKIRKLVRETTHDQAPSRAVFASVVPDVRFDWEHGVGALFGIHPLWVGSDTNLGIAITYPNPQTIGADRLANASAVVVRYGVPAIVLDFGTALTVDVILETKGFVGGVIAPGLPLMLNYLADKAVQLPRIEPAPVRRAIGKSTEEAMRIGARNGYRGLVHGILDPLIAKVGSEQVHLCATGGYACWVLKDLVQEISFDADLTLFGLGHIGDLQGGE